MTQFVRDYAPPPAAPAPAIPWWQSETMIGGITATLLPAVLALLVYYGVLDGEGATLWGAIGTALAGLLVVFGRINGGVPPSPIAKSLTGAPR